MKVFERIVHNQLSTYLNETMLLCEYQSGFRSKFSSETALIYVAEYIINGLDSGKLVGAVNELKNIFNGGLRNPYQKSQRLGIKAIFKIFEQL